MKNKTKYILIPYLILLFIFTIIFYDTETLVLIPVVMILGFIGLIFDLLKHSTILDENAVRMTPMIYSIIKNNIHYLDLNNVYFDFFHIKKNQNDSKWEMTSVFLDSKTQKLYCRLNDYINPVELSNISYITDYNGQLKQYIINFKREINHNTYLGTFLSTINKQDIR